MKALIVYGTRGGATRVLAEYLEKGLKGQGYETSVKDARDSKDIDVNNYDLVVVGSSVWASRWTGEAKNFVKRNEKALSARKVALFSSGIAGNDPANTGSASKSITAEAAKYPLIKPISLAYFGGYLDFNSPSLLTRFVSGFSKKKLASQGIKTDKPYDGRDWTAIWQWSLDLAAKAR
jgi:menaquinone-dependent protoporphyrinogen oxidase